MYNYRDISNLFLQYNGKNLVFEFNYDKLIDQNIINSYITVAQAIYQTKCENIIIAINNNFSVKNFDSITDEDFMINRFYDFNIFTEYLFNNYRHYFKKSHNLKYKFLYKLKKENYYLNNNPNNFPLAKNSIMDRLIAKESGICIFNYHDHYLSNYFKYLVSIFKLSTIVIDVLYTPQEKRRFLDYRYNDKIQAELVKILLESEMIKEIKLNEIRVFFLNHHQISEFLTNNHLKIYQIISKI